MRMSTLKKLFGGLFRSILVFVLGLVTFSLLWAEDAYGNIGFDEVIFHLNIPKKGVAHNILESYIKEALVPAILFIVAIWVIRKLYCVVKDKGYGFDIGYELECIVFGHTLSKKAKKKILCLGIIFIWIILIIFKADKAFGFIEWTQNMFKQSKFIENEYRNPNELNIIFPDNKRNLICIFLESGETSLQDVENGGFFEENYIPELT